MAFDHTTGLFTPSFDLVGNRQAGGDILPGDLQALFTEFGAASRALIEPNGTLREPSRRLPARA